jgi:hypothetical protein
MPEIISRKDAVARGLNRYFTGKPCSIGHISERYISKNCRQCNIEKAKIRYVDNREMICETLRIHRQKNPDKANEKKRKWNLENRERVRATNRNRKRRARAALRALIELGIEI